MNKQGLVGAARTLNVFYLHEQDRVAGTCAVHGIEGLRGFILYFTIYRYLLASFGDFKYDAITSYLTRSGSMSAVSLWQGKLQQQQNE